MTFLADNIRQTHGCVAVQASVVATRRRLRAIRAHGCSDRWIPYAGCDDALDDVGIYALGIVHVFEFRFGGICVCGEPVEELKITTTDEQK